MRSAIIGAYVAALVLALLLFLDELERRIADLEFVEVKRNLEPETDE